MFKTKQEKIQNEKKEKITDNHYEAKNKLSMRKESKHHKKNLLEKAKKKKEARGGKRSKGERNNDTCECNIGCNVKQQRS